MKELTSEMSFRDAILFLCLEEGELEEFINLCAEETHIREDEDARVTRATERQMAMIDSGNLTASSDNWSAILIKSCMTKMEVYHPHQLPS